MHLLTDLRHFSATKSAQDKHNRRRSQSRRPKSAQVTIAQAKIGAEIMNQFCCIRALIKKFVCEVNSFAFNGNSLR